MVASQEQEIKGQKINKDIIVLDETTTVVVTTVLGEEKFSNSSVDTYYRHYDQDYDFYSLGQHIYTIRAQDDIDYSPLYRTVVMSSPTAHASSADSSINIDVTTGSIKGNNTAQASVIHQIIGNNNSMLSRKLKVTANYNGNVTLSAA